MYSLEILRKFCTKFGQDPVSYILVVNGVKYTVAILTFKVHNFEKLKEIQTTFLNAPTKFLLRELKSNKKRWRRILLGDNTDDGAVILLPIGFHCIGVSILPAVPSTLLHSWLYVFCCELHKIRHAPNLPERNSSVSWKMSATHTHSHSPSSSPHEVCLF